MAPSCSSSSSYLSIFFSIFSLLSFFVSTVGAVAELRSPVRPRDLLPLLPREVSWPILDSLHSPLDLLPTFVGSASPSPSNNSLEWKGACFYMNTAWIEFHNKSGGKFGGGTLHIKVDNAHSWTCMDLYVFATPYRITWDYFFLSREHKVEFKQWAGKAEYEYVQQRGVSIFLMEAGMLGTLRALWDVFPLFTNTGWGEKANIQFLEKHTKTSFEKRPEPWVTNITTDDIHSGDFIAISKIRGRWGGFETLEKWVTGSYAGHSAVFLRDSDGKLWVAESGNENDNLPSVCCPTTDCCLSVAKDNLTAVFFQPSLQILLICPTSVFIAVGEDVIALLPWDEWWEFELTKDDSNPHIAVLPLHPDIRAKFNETAAWEYARSMEGKPYGYHNMIFSWIDTIRNNYPPPLDAHLVASVMTVWSQLQPSYASNLWNEALNKRLGTEDLDLPEILVETEKRGSSFAELLTVPEQDDWLYIDGKSTSCVALVLEMYKEAGLFGPYSASIQVTEFTIKDAYTLRFFEDNPSRLPSWCNDGDDVKLPYCQIRGMYRMELPEYNTIEPYPHMNERCPSLPPKYNRPENC